MKIFLILLLPVMFSSKLLSQMEMKMVFEEAGPTRVAIKVKDSNRALMVGKEATLKSEDFLSASAITIKNERFIVGLQISEKAKEKLEILFSDSKDAIEMAFVHQGVVLREVSLMPIGLSSIAVSGFESMQEAELFASKFTSPRADNGAR